MSLTTACCVQSNVYGLGNIQWIRYLTAVDPLLSTSSTAQTYHHLTSGSIEIPLCITAENSSSIGKEPVLGRYVFTGIRRSATSSLVSFAEQGIMSFTNVLQSHITVVLVHCTIEWEPDITCTWKGRETNIRNLFHMIKFNVQQTAPIHVVVARCYS